MKKLKLNRMVGIAILMALVIVMQFLTGIIPPIGGFSISLVLIPIVIGAALYGPAAGAILGGTFGAIVYINCITGSDVGGAMVFQASPILCFWVIMTKGILAGLCSGLIYSAFKEKNRYIAILLSAIVCPIVNTGVFIISMLLFFIDVLASWAGGGNIAGYILTGLILANFVPELIINIVFSPASRRIIEVVEK